MTLFARSNWATTVLVCRKCTKRVGGGFGAKGRTSLAKALRKWVGGRGRKARTGVVEVKCLGVCPRGAVTVVNGADSRAWLLVRPGTAVEDVAGRLGL